jgi:Transposase DDE domain group 1
VQPLDHPIEVTSPLVALRLERNPARLSCHAFGHNAIRLQLLRTLALPEEVEHWSLTTLREKLVKIGARIVRHGRYVVFQLAEVAVPRALFAEILRRIDQLRPKSTPLAA